MIPEVSDINMTAFEYERGSDGGAKPDFVL
jgi:hypothetical protein